jgi:hypothetical protein
MVDARGLHSLSCKRSSGRVARHNHLNDLIWRALVKAHIPSTKEPVGLSRSDGKRPDGLTLVPWKSGKSAVWDVTVSDTLAASYVDATSTSAGAAAELASAKKLDKYATLSQSFEVIPVAFETLGPVCSLGSEFLSDIGKALFQVSGDPREASFLRQRLSVAIQKHNSSCFLQSFINPDSELLDNI